MFNGCAKVQELDVSGFDTSNVRYIGNMFNGCESVSVLDVNGFNTKNMMDMDFMLCGHKQINQWQQLIMH